MAKKTNFTVNGKEYYRVSRVVGKKSDGSPNRKYFYGSCKNEAENKASEYVSRLKTGFAVDFESISLGEFVHDWLFKKLINSSEIKPSTFQRYEGIYRNYIKESDVEMLKLYQVKSIHLQEYYNKLYKKDCTYSQIKTLNTFLKTFFNYCYNEGYVNKNPCHNISIPEKKSEVQNKLKQKIEVLTDDEIQKIKKELKDEPYELLFLWFYNISWGGKSSNCFFEQK